MPDSPEQPAPETTTVPAPEQTIEFPLVQEPEMVPLPPADEKGMVQTRYGGKERKGAIVRIPKKLPDGVVKIKVPRKPVLKAVNTLGLDENGPEWTRAKLLALSQLGELLSLKLVARTQLVMGFKSIDQVKVGLEVCSKLAADPELAPELRIGAASCLAKCAEAFTKMSEQLVDYAERSQDKISTEKPKNLPPQVALQVNLNQRDGSANSDCKPVPSGQQP